MPICLYLKSLVPLPTVKFVQVGVYEVQASLSHFNPVDEDESGLKYDVLALPTANLAGVLSAVAVIKSPLASIIESGMNN